MLCWSHIPHCWKSHALAHFYYDKNALFLNLKVLVTVSCLQGKIFSHLPVRGITCTSYNLYHLKKLKLCHFNNNFKVRPSKVTYLGYI